MDGDFFIGASLASVLTKLSIRFAFDSLVSRRKGIETLAFQVQLGRQGREEAEQVHRGGHAGPLLHPAFGKTFFLSFVTSAMTSLI